MYGKENKYKLARALKIDVAELMRALDDLEKEGRIEIKTGRVIPLKGKKARKKKEEIQKPGEAQKEEPEEEQAEEVTEKGEEIEEQPEETETTEEISAEEEPKEETEPFEEEPEELTEEERIKGTVKFYNPNKGFGFITGGDGKEYYVHESGLKEGVTIETDNRVFFKVVQGDKGSKAEDVEWISQA